MRILLIAISFILSYQVSGQAIDKALQIFADKQVKPLKEFVDEPRETSLRFEIFREVIPGYREGVLEIHEQKKDQKDQKVLVIRHLKINFLSSDQTIFYYHFDKMSVKENSGKFKDYVSLTDSFTNIELYKRFEQNFHDSYGVNIDKSDLFQTSVVYGNSCGIAGIPPEFQEKLDSLIKSNDLTSIRNWLRSPNSEKQLYAIQGLIRMEKKLYYISVADRKVIDLIKRKKGQVNVCYGCLHTQDGIQKILLSIDNSLRTPKRTKTDIILSIVYGSIAILLLMFSIKGERKG